MSVSQNTIALNAQRLADDVGSDGVPEWVHLLPVAAGPIATGDNRGPYHVRDAAAIITASLQGEMDLVIDENHATDLAAPKGLPAPARGWITALEARADGIWGQVKWSDEGRELVKSRAYRAISPVILHDKAKNVLRILRASLINKPNLRGLTALNMENDDMSFLAKLAAQLGLNAEASEEDVTGGIAALQSTDSDDATALQSRRSEASEISASLAFVAAACESNPLDAAQIRGTDGDGGALIALQGELNTVTDELNTLKENGQRDKASAFVDGAIREKRVGVSSQRDRFIAMHMKEPDETEALIGNFPMLDRSSTTLLPPAAKDGDVSLNAEQSGFATMLGVSPDDYAKTLKAEEEARQ